MRWLERQIETLIFVSRWILAPFYLGLCFCLLLMLFHFFRELVHFVAKIWTATEADVTLGVLALIDITFTANLVIIVIFSGYENFVSRIDTGEGDKPEWMAKVDFGGLKQKLMTSIVAISAIQVLQAFMNLDKSVDSTVLAWLVGIHVLFLGSLIALGIVDRLEALSGDQNEVKEK